MREHNSEEVYFEERDEDSLLPARSRHKVSGHRPKLPLRTRSLSPFFKLPDLPDGESGIRYEKVRGIKNLVEKGQYETEEKIRVTAARILSRM